MSKYLLKFSSYMLPEGRQFKVDGVVVSISKNNIIVDVLDLVKSQTYFDKEKLMAKVNSVYASLILNFKFEPYISKEIAKDIILDSRNDEVIEKMQSELDAKLEKLRFEKNRKKEQIVRDVNNEVAELEAKLNKELQDSIGSLNKEEAYIIQQQDEVTKELPQTELIQIKEELMKAQSRAEKFRMQMIRQQGTIENKIQDYKKKKGNNYMEVENQYNLLIEEEKQKGDIAIIQKAKELSERKKIETELIEKILNFELPETEKPKTKETAKAEKTKK